MLRIFLLLAVTIFSCASQQYAPKENEEFYGTWNNKDYPSHEHQDYPLFGVQQIVCSPDGTVETSNMFWEAGGVVRSYAYTITDKWSDSDRNLFYKQIWDCYFEYNGKRHEMGRFFVVVKVNPSKQTLEIVLDESDFPTKVDTSHDQYRIYFRTK